jgi:deoxyadenosine/deoxycytidine kinase
MKIIIFEGNIGAGKTTALDTLYGILQEHGVECYKIIEPIDKWEKCKNTNNETQLSSFYKNKAQNSFSFQLVCQISRLIDLCSLKTMPSNAIILMERGLESGNEIFGELLVDGGFMSRSEQDFVKTICKTLLPIDQLNFETWFIDTSIDKCLERIQNRNRGGESFISDVYLKELHSKYQKLKIDYKVDGNQDVMNVARQLKTILSMYGYV